MQLLCYKEEYELHKNLRKLFKCGFFCVLLITLSPLAYKIGPVQIQTTDVVLWPLLILNLSVYCLNFRIFKVRVISLDLLLLALLIFLTVIQLFTAHYINSINELKVYWNVFFLYFLTRMFLQWRVLSIKILFNWWSFFAVFLILLGILQFCTGSSIGQVGDYFGENLDQGSVYSALGIHRISGTASNPNVYGQWVVMFSLYLNAKLFFCKKSDSQKFLLLILFLLQPVVIVATLSRGIILFWIFANSIFILIWILKVNRALPFKLLFMVLIIFVFTSGILLTYERITYLNTFASRLDSQAGGSDEKRIVMFKEGFNALSHVKVLLLGTGLASYYPYILNKEISEGPSWRYTKDSSDRIHNVFFIFAVEGGLISFVLFILIIIYIWCCSLKIMNILRNSSYRYIGIYLFTLINSLIIPLSVYNSTISSHVLYFLIVIVALITHFYKNLILYRKEFEV